MILDKFKLDGKVAIVTGSSTGLGQGVCLAFAEAGAKVVGVDYVESTETKNLIEGMGRKFLEIKANLMSIAAIPDIVARTLAAFGRLDILVNNAGIIRREDAIDFSEKNWDDVMDINAKTVFFLQPGRGEAVHRPGFGRQDHQYSLNALLPGAASGYPRTRHPRAAVMGITRLMANEWAKYGINANAMAPGYMATNNTAPIRADAERSEAILERIPAGRWGTPADVQGLAVFLASEASDYINGYTVAVDGGWLAR